MSNFHLPKLGALKEKESTYITFSKALTDLDKAHANHQPYYFTKMVLLNLPDWQEGQFYLSRELPLTNVDKSTDNPNVAIPLYIQHYMENICRQQIDSPHVTEIAFWQMMDKLGFRYSQYDTPSKAPYVCDVIHSDFYKLESNVGWARIIGQIPAHISFKTIQEKQISLSQRRILTNDFEDVEDNRGLYDTGLNEIVLNNPMILDLDNIQDYNSYGSSNEEAQFNVILMYYMDSDGVHKLHGINFINRYVNKVGYWELERLPLRTIESKQTSIGYQFLFNMKTCNNEATLTQVHSNNENLGWYHGFEQTFNYMHRLLDKIDDNHFNKINV